MTSFWCERAVLPSGVARGVRVVSELGVIVSADLADSQPGDTLLEGLTLPGLANAHSHAFHRALRGTTHADGGTFWTWREAMYAIADNLDPDNYRQLAHAVFAEMVLAGYTVVGEFHYVHHQLGGEPYVEPAAMEKAILEAAALAGIRITLLDTLYLTGGLDAAGQSLPQSPSQQRFGDGSVEAWAARRAQLSDSPTALIGAAIHSLRSVPVAELPAFREATVGVPVHAHVSEQPAENEQVLAASGSTPVALLAGFLGDTFTAVHATHLTPADIEQLTGSFACFCPTTERDLADGIGPARALADAGAHLCLGSDQHAVIDPFEELRGLELNERLASGKRGRFTPGELLRAASATGYASLGWTGGSIAVGSLCDLVAITRDSPRTAGSSDNQAWLAATSADVRTVVVGGEIIVENGVHRSGDVGALLSEAIERVRS